ncbi:hypothetical protein [Ruegeria sp.]|uniref:hypothetical protein n=1 Tax=Ruegeria sp. TaxID=1879320 RepID=UPI003AFFCE93
MMEYLLTKSFKAGAGVAARRVCRITDPDAEAVQAAGPGFLPLGISADLGARTGGAVDIHLAGIAMLEAGGAFSAGTLVSGDAKGRGIRAPRGGLHQRVVDGGAANAALAVPGLGASDRLVGVIELADGYADRLGQATLTDDAGLSISVATTGDRLLVSWQARAHAVGIALQAAHAPGDLIRVLIVPQQI